MGSFLTRGKPEDLPIKLYENTKLPGVEVVMYILLMYSYFYHRELDVFIFKII